MQYEVIKEVTAKASLCFLHLVTPSMPLLLKTITFMVLGVSNLNVTMYMIRI